MVQTNQDTGTPGSEARVGLLLTETLPAPTDLDATSAMCYFGDILGTNRREKPEKKLRLGGPQ